MSKYNEKNQNISQVNQTISLETEKPNPVQVISITGGKGGIGKSNIALNLAICLAKLGKKVMLLDAALGMGNIDVLLGLQINKNLFHVLNGECELKDIIVNGPFDIKIVPSSSGIATGQKLERIHHGRVVHAFDSITDQLDVLIVDTASGISEDVMCFTSASHEIVVTVCNEPTSITDAYAQIKMLHQNFGVKSFKIATNMVENAEEGKILFKKLLKITERFLDIVIYHTGNIPYDKKLKQSVQKQKAVCELYPNSKSSLAIYEMALSSLMWPLSKNSDGSMGFFLERRFKSEK